jgi:hypothetical protein
LVYSEWEKDGAKRSKHSVIGRVAFGSDDRSAGNQVAGGEARADE